MLLLRSIFFTFLLPGSVIVLIPYLILRGSDHSDLGAIRYLGLPFIIIGGIGDLWCIWQFFSEGRGTLAPIDPPKHLVVHGLYRYVRNPMYVSVTMILIGEAIYFMSLPILIVTAIFVVLVTLFVKFYEEPVLEKKFGESYVEYRQNVSRWIPRLPK